MPFGSLVGPPGLKASFTATWGPPDWVRYTASMLVRTGSPLDLLPGQYDQDLYDRLDRLSDQLDLPLGFARLSGSAGATYGVEVYGHGPEPEVVGVGVTLDWAMREAIVCLQGWLRRPGSRPG